MSSIEDKLTALTEIVTQGRIESAKHGVQLASVIEKIDTLADNFAEHIVTEDKRAASIASELSKYKAEHNGWWRRQGSKALLLVIGGISGGVGQAILKMFQ